MVTSALSFLFVTSCSAEHFVSNLGVIVEPPSSHRILFCLLLLAYLMCKMLLYGLVCYMVLNFYQDLEAFEGCLPNVQLQLQVHCFIKSKKSCWPYVYHLFRSRRRCCHGGTGDSCPAPAGKHPDTCSGTADEDKKILN